MKWDDLKIFLAAFRTGSCASAGRQLRLSQSTVSRRLAAFEEALDTPLFVRAPEGLVALPAAERLLGLAEGVESHMLALPIAVAEPETSIEGVVRVALAEAMASELVAPALPDLLERHPKLVVEFATGDGIVNLSRREADLALRLVRPIADDLVSARVANVSFGVFGHRDYLERHRGVGAENLAWVDWGPSQPGLPGSEWIRTFFPSVSPVFRTTSLSARLSLLQAGLGVGVVADALAAMNPNLLRVADVPALPSLSLWLAGRKAVRDVPRIKVVWEFLKECAARLEQPRLPGKTPDF